MYDANDTILVRKMAKTTKIIINLKAAHSKWEWEQEHKIKNAVMLKDQDYTWMQFKTNPFTMQLL